MEHAARRFARRILLVHALLLAAVLAVVVMAGLQIYRTAQAEVLAQARGRQQMLAAATARGVENHYASILNDMDLLRRADSATAASQPAAGATSRPTGNSALERFARLIAANRASNPGQLGGVIGSGVMWRQLQGRATALFAYDRLAPAAGRFVLPPLLIGSDDPNVTPDAVIRQSAEWLGAQHAPSISEFQAWGGVAGNLVCVPLRGDPFRFNPNGRGRPLRVEAIPAPDGTRVESFRVDVGRFGAGPDASEPRPSDEAGPFGPRGGRAPGEWQPSTRPTRGEQGQAAGRRVDNAPHDWALVALVPISRVQQDYLQLLGEDQATGAWLIDQRGQAMAANRSDLMGSDMSAVADPEIRALATRASIGHFEGCVVIDRPVTVGGAHFPPAMIAGEPVVIGNRQWELFVSTTLDSVNGNVNRLFRRVVWWGGAVGVLLAGILASTAWWLIRSRTRVERLRHQVLNKELAEARRIQLAWLPKSTPSTAVVDVAAVNSPASHISGDFYNWFELPDGRLAVAIGDVTGHGMSAAFLMATTQLLVRTTLSRLPDPGACLAEVNRHLCVQAFNGQFVTMLIAVLDPVNHRLHLATAGHPAPFLVTDGRAFHPLPMEPQLVLGVEVDAEYQTESHDLPAGAGLLLYTDGVIECPAGEETPHAGHRFGTDRLRIAVAHPPSGNGSARSTVDRVVAAVDAFRGARELNDDLTIVAVQLRTAAMT